MHHISTKFFIASFLLAAFVVPFTPARAAEDLEVAGWIPYWRDSQGIKDAKKHIDEIDTVYPFAYTVKTDGTISDQAGLTDREWKSFMKTARAKDVEVIPTIMWSSGETTHAILSDTKAREKHIDSIISMVKKGGYDGVDIDYEAKKSETILFFSLFLAQLKMALGEDKVLSCTIEARTPPDSLYKDVPKTINYANDYSAINVFCDRVVIMAYDQQRADIKANEERRGAPYVPVADPLWVEKVVKLALKSFPEEKVVLGIPTYGRHWAVTVAPEWYRDYRSIGALNVPDMLDVADDYNVTPSRNAAGEMSFTYLPKSTDSKIAKAIKKMSVPKGTSKGEKIAAQSLAYANKTGTEVTFNVGWYSDAGAIIDKIEMAKEYGLRGISLFKIDGEEDQDVWDYLEDNN
jgi:spore germination protein YaaH